MMLSKYFSLAEMMASQIAARKHLDNTPNPEQIENLTDTCRQLDRIRDYLQKPIHVSSGFRSAKVNASIGGSKTSSHLQGYAADITCPDLGSAKELFEAIRHSGIQFDQLILEHPESVGGWVHVGVEPRMRGQVLVFDGHEYKAA